MQADESLLLLECGIFIVTLEYDLSALGGVHHVLCKSQHIRDALIPTAPCQIA